jgi:phosphoserine phosphatase RsbU/P
VTTLTQPYRIRCAEIWGGIQNLNTDICTSSITASVFSQAHDGTAGGDIYYFSVCGYDLLTRIAIADLRGHGSQAATLSRWIYDGLQERIEDLEGGELLASVNRAASEKGFQAMTTAAVMSFYLGDSHFYYSYAGHPPILRNRHGETKWTPLEVPHGAPLANLPLGAFPGATFDQVRLPIEPGDRFLIYTDGVIEQTGMGGELFGSQRLQEVLAACGSCDPATIKQRIVEELREFACDQPLEDDVTFLVLEVHAAADKTLP